MNLNRLLPLLIPLLVFLLEEVYFFYPRLIYLIVVLAILLIFFALWQLTRLSTVDKSWWNYLILPALMTGALIAYTVFLSSQTLIQLLLIFNLVFLYVYLRHVYYYLLNPLAYEVFSIENLSSYINFLTFFFLAAVAYGLQSFLNVQITALALIMLVSAVLAVYQIIWANKIDLKTAWPFILVSCLLLVELFWSISFLPFNYNISGFCLAVSYYLIIGLVKNYLLDKLDAKKVRMYLALGLISLFLVLLTAKWL